MAVGNILEVKEAIDTLKGNGPDDFVELIETLASHMLILGGAAKDFDEGLMRVRESIQSGKALENSNNLLLHKVVIRNTSIIQSYLNRQIL